MALAAFQGFEYMKPTALYTTQLAAIDLANYLGFALPANTANWFKDASGGYSTASGPLIVATDYRVAGQSLQIQRPDAGTYNADFNGTKPIPIQYNLAVTNRVVLGFGFKFDKLPNQAICLVQFGYDDGVSNVEQASLWLSTSGMLFFSSVSFDMANTGLITPAMIAGLSTPPGALRVNIWSYVEVMLDMIGATPYVSINVNGVAVLTQAYSAGLRKAATALITSAAIVNNHNGYFTGGYTHWIDDIYVLRSQTGLPNTMLGPQQIIYLKPNGATATTNWTPAAGANYANVNTLFDPTALTAYVQQTATNQIDIYTVDDLAASIGNVTAVAARTFTGLLSAGSGGIISRLYNSAGTYIDSGGIPITSTAPRVVSMYSTAGPGGVALTPTVVNDLQVGIDGV